MQKQREERPRGSCCSSAGSLGAFVSRLSRLWRVISRLALRAISFPGWQEPRWLAGNCYLSPPPALFLSPEQTDAHGPKTGMEKARKEEKTTPEQPTLTAPKPLFKHAHSPVTQAARCPPKPPYPNERSRGEPRTEGGAPQLRPTRLRASDCPAAASWGGPWLSTALVPPRVLATCSTGLMTSAQFVFSPGSKTRPSTLSPLTIEAVFCDCDASVALRRPSKVSHAPAFCVFRSLRHFPGPLLNAAPKRNLPDPERFAAGLPKPVPYPSEPSSGLFPVLPHSAHPKSRTTRNTDHIVLLPNSPTTGPLSHRPSCYGDTT
jgi:hypothetical protein